MSYHKLSPLARKVYDRYCTDRDAVYLNLEAVRKADTARRRATKIAGKRAGRSK